MSNLVCEAKSGYRRHASLLTARFYTPQKTLMKFKLLNADAQRTYAVILESGDEVMQNMLAFTRQQQLKASQFNAIGAFSSAMLGFFDFSTKDYRKIPVSEQVEVLNVAGDISEYKGEYRIHAHVVVGKSDGSAHGGHLIRATVHPTLEVIVTESPAHLVRRMDDESGIPLINIGT